MPVYEYKCSKCGAQLEVRQSFSAAPPEAHKVPDSDQECTGPLEKLLSLSTFALKGKWFKEGY